MSNDLYRHVLREIHEAEEADRPVERIHVTPSALRGSLVGVTTVKAHDEGDREIREIAIHPEDWRDLLVQVPSGYLSRFALASPPTSVYGVPVVQAALTA